MKSTYGKLNLILGCMYSSKSSTLISRHKRYTIGNKKCLLIKYAGDDRYDIDHIVTHDGIKVPATVCRHLMEVDNLVHKYDVICIDEIQFYKDAHIFCDKWANQGLIVEACGLNGTFKRTQFSIISKLIPMADNITFMTAISRETGNDAIYSKRISDEIDDVVIGGFNKYIAADRETYFKNISPMEYHMNKIEEILDILYEDEEISISTEEIEDTLMSIDDLNINTKIDYVGIINSSIKKLIY